MKQPRSCCCVFSVYMYFLLKILGNTAVFSAKSRKQKTKPPEKPSHSIRSTRRLEQHEQRGLCCWCLCVSYIFSAPACFSKPSSRNYLVGRRGSDARGTATRLAGWHCAVLCCHGWGAGRGVRLRPRLRIRGGDPTGQTAPGIGAWHHGRKKLNIFTYIYKTIPAHKHEYLSNVAIILENEEKFGRCGWGVRNPSGTDGFMNDVIQALLQATKFVKWLDPEHEICTAVAGTSSLVLL